MFKYSSLRSFALVSACAAIMAGCAVAPGYSDAEKDIKASLANSKFQPASRETRDNIETQELFAQAAFWSREYELNPADLETAIKLSAAVRKLGNPKRAVEIAQTSRALYPRDPYLTAEFAAALIASEQGYEAMQPLDTALRTTPGYARLWSLKGAALDQQEEYEIARKHYARALKITPNDPNIMANIGLNFALSGDPQTAEGWLRRAVSVPGASQSVRQNLSLILQLQGKEAEAAKYSGHPQLRGTTKVGQSAPQKIAQRPQQRTPQQRTPQQRTQQQRVPQQRVQQRPQQQRANQTQKSFQASPTSVRPNNYAPRSYPQANTGIPASERGNGYQPSYAQPTSNKYSSNQAPRTITSRNNAPLTASDAARQASQQSSRGKITLPLEENLNAHTAEQRSVLEQIAKTIGPQASGHLPKRSLQANAQTNYPQQQPAPYTNASPQYPSTVQTPQYAAPSYPQGRQAARTRR